MEIVRFDYKSDPSKCLPSAVFDETTNSISIVNSSGFCRDVNERAFRLPGGESGLRNA